MGFGIIHDEMLGSSLAEVLDPELKLPVARDVFVWLCVLADPDGRVHDSLPALARRLNYPADVVKRALEVLLAPDENSRSRENGGRRVVPLNGRGWRVVNYRRYARSHPHRESRDLGPESHESRDQGRKSREKSHESRDPGQKSHDRDRESHESRDADGGSCESHDSVNALFSAGEGPSRDDRANRAKNRAPLLDVDTDRDDTRQGRDAPSVGVEEWEVYRRRVYRAWRVRTGKSSGFTKRMVAMIRRWWDAAIPSAFVEELIRAGPVPRSLIWFEKRVPEHWERRGSGNGPPAPTRAELDPDVAEKLAEVVRIRSLDPEDCKLVASLLEQGMPLALMLGTLQDLVRSRSRHRPKVQRLRYFRVPLERAYQRFREVWAAKAAPPPPEAEIPLTELLEVLGSWVPESVPGRRELVQRILSITDRTTAEDELGRLDGEMVEACASVCEDLDEHLSSHRWPSEEAKESGRVRFVRDAFGLPLLSLFSAELGDVAA